MGLIWVQVDGPGMWYAREVRRVLRGVNLAVAVTMSGVSRPELESFSLVPYTLRVPSGPPPLAAEWYLGGLPREQLNCLRTLARLQRGYTREIAAMVGVEIFMAFTMLHELVEKGYARITIMWPLSQNNSPDRRKEAVVQAGREKSDHSGR
jgi:hypothetical protein